MTNTPPELRNIRWLFVMIVLMLTGVAWAKAEDETPDPSSSSTKNASVAVSLSDGHGDDALEQSLLEAWEQVQKNDRRTVVFEQVEPGSPQASVDLKGETARSREYRFHTKWFPFDGRLRVVNVAVGDQQQWYGQQTPVMGVVEVQLEGLDDDFMTRHAQSYSMWQQTNMLYHDPRTGRWVTMDEYAGWVEDAVTDTAVGNGWGCLLTGSVDPFWITFLVVVLVFLAVLSRNASKSMKRTMAAQDKVIAEQERGMRLSEQAVEINQDNNRVLKEILEVIKAAKRP